VAPRWQQPANQHEIRQAAGSIPAASTICKTMEDVKVDIELFFFGRLCLDCMEKVEESGRRLFDLGPGEWGFCQKSLEATHMACKEVGL
jgi:hypothetical protein